ncbi:transposase [Pedobacter westerhofensis]|uniref:transposase n=1 Tax=Pedobacter westerhofensis TaxID=425512 RepID=UPI00115A27E0
MSGEFDLETNRDCAGSFEPIVLPKRQAIITKEVKDKVVGLYRLGLSTKDFTKIIKDIYRRLSLQLAIFN